MDTASPSSPILGGVIWNKTGVVAFLSEAVYREVTISLSNRVNSTIESPASSD
jgi:hypothetical protein